MSKNWLKQKITLLISVMLIAAMALSLCGCGSAEEPAVTSEPTSSTVDTPKYVTEKLDGGDIGEGATKFTLIVDNGKGEVVFNVSTNKTTVGEALTELKLIDGDENDMGLYVKSVNGDIADYDVDKTYWALYINGEYAPTGVDSTNIEDGVTYTLKIEKA